MNLTVDESHSLLKGRPAEEVLGWALEKFGDRVAIASSFGAEDVVLIDMAVKAEPGVRVFTLDTGRLHQETYDLMDEIRRRYGVKIEVCFPDREKVGEITELHGPNPFYENAELRKLCCSIRKVKPLMEKLGELDAWVCGLRQEQSVTRASIMKVERDGESGLRNGVSGLVKVNPLADWSTRDVWDYIKKNNVPYNKLHDQGFPSIGCVPCTRAVGMCEEVRSGRWWWEDPMQKECGLHSS